MAPLPDKPRPTIAAVYAAYEAAQGTGYREHLGASIIGTECERALWYSFHWTTRARHAGRLLRLFETGNLEEARFAADLRRIGAIVLDLDPETGKQWRVRDETGHFGGSLDAKALGILEAPKTWHLAEFKTHNNKNFEKIKRLGVQRAKPLHYAQTQSYMHLAGLERTFYYAKNKDTDDLWSDRWEYDAAFAKPLVEKAQRVINASRPPSRVSADPAWWQCRFCDHNAACHGDAMPERHCRSCLHSSPIEDGKWFCAVHDAELPRDAQEIGCDRHLYIPDFVHGEQIDATDCTVTYLIRGERWVDGVTA